jgi:Circadian oscillating protein COP23
MKLLPVAALLQRQSLSLGLVTVAIVTGNSLLATSSQAGTATKFVCGQSNGFPSTIAKTKKGDVPIVNWQSEEMTVPPQVRCQQVSARFQSLYQSGQLKYITAGTIMTAGKKVPVVCATKKVGGTCTSQNLLYTLQPKADPQTVIKKLSDIRNRASSERIYESGALNVSFELDSLEGEN